MPLNLMKLYPFYIKLECRIQTKLSLKKLVSVRIRFYFHQIANNKLASIAKINIKHSKR